MYKNLRALRESLKMTQAEFGKSVGVSKSTYNNYEIGTREPKSDFWISVARKYNVTIDYLMGYSNNPNKTSEEKPSDLSPQTMELVQRYDALDPYGQATVTAVLDCEYKRCTDKGKASSQKIVEIFPTRHYLQPASAGYGDFNDDESYEMIDLVKRPPNGTSFIITVHGDSMEPTYKEGDLLFVRSQNQLNVGDKGIVTIGALTFVKELGPDGLISHNPNYAPPEPFEDTPVIIQGKVLGICTEDYLA